MAGVADDAGIDVPEAGPGYSDAARRMADAVNLHLAAVGLAAVGKWVACRMSDGVSDGVLYDTRREAVAHQFHEQFCAYVHVPVTGMTPRQAENYLAFTRQCYDNGIRTINNVDADAHVNVPIDYTGGRLT